MQVASEHSRFTVAALALSARAREATPAPRALATRGRAATVALGAAFCCWAEATMGARTAAVCMAAGALGDLTGKGLRIKWLGGRARGAIACDEVDPVGAWGCRNVHAHTRNCGTVAPSRRPILAVGFRGAPLGPGALAAAAAHAFSRPI